MSPACHSVIGSLAKQDLGGSTIQILQQSLVCAVCCVLYLWQVSVLQTLTSLAWERCSTFCKTITQRGRTVLHDFMCYKICTSWSAHVFNEVQVCKHQSATRSLFFEVVHIWRCCNIDADFQVAVLHINRIITAFSCNMIGISKRPKLCESSQRWLEVAPDLSVPLSIPYKTSREPNLGRARMYILDTEDLHKLFLNRVLSL